MHDVADYLNAAINLALAQMPERHERWIRTSHIVGRFRKPSLLAADVERLGRLDLILCSLENSKNFSGNEEFLFAYDFFSSLSSVWVRSAYSTLYAIAKEDKSDAMEVLFYDVDRLRLTLEKYQIPKDRDIPKDADGKKKIELYTSDGLSSQTYDLDDFRRAIIPPMGIANDGSFCWQIIDLRKSQSRWLSRRSLADRYLTLFEQSGSGSIEAG